MSLRVIMGLVAVVVALVGCEGPDVPGALPLTSGAASNTLFNPSDEGGMDAKTVAKKVCQKLSSCLGGEVMQGCVGQMVRFTSFVIDGESFVSCFNAIPCADLQQYGRISEYIESCLGLDMSSLSCSGDAIHYCDIQGRCKDIPCAEFCELLGSQGDRCVYGDDGPMCDCVQDQIPIPMPPGG